MGGRYRFGFWRIVGHSLQEGMEGVGLQQGRNVLSLSRDLSVRSPPRNQAGNLQVRVRGEDTREHEAVEVRMPE